MVLSVSKWRFVRPIEYQKSMTVVIRRSAWKKWCGCPKVSLQSPYMSTGVVCIPTSEPRPMWWFLQKTCSLTCRLAQSDGSWCVGVLTVFFWVRFSLAVWTSCEQQKQTAINSVVELTRALHWYNVLSLATIMSLIRICLGLSNLKGMIA